MRPVICRCSGDNAVIIAGESLRFHQRLPAAVRTAREICVLQRMLAVKLFHNRLRVPRHFVNRTIAEIGHFLRMADRPASVRAGRRVPGVSRGRRITFVHRKRQRELVDFTGKPTVPAPLQPSVPALQRHPHFNLNVGIRAWMRLNPYPAERRQ